MSKRVHAVALAVLLCAGFAVWWMGSDRSSTAGLSRSNSALTHSAPELGVGTDPHDASSRVARTIDSPAAAPTTSPLDIHPIASLRVIAKYARSAAPVEHMLVRLSSVAPGGMGLAVHTAYTDSAGECLVTSLEPGMAQIETDRDFFSTSILKPGANSLAVTIAIGVSVSGVVHCPDGTPLAGATVVATGPGGGTYSVATTDDFGRYSIASLRAQARLSCAHSSYLSPPLHSIRAPAGSSATLDWTMLPGPPRKLAVIIRDESGLPRSGANVVLSPKGSLTAHDSDLSVAILPFALRADTNELGAANFDALLPLDYQVRAEVPGYPMLTAMAAKSDTEIRLKLKAGVSVDGTVVDEHGIPIPFCHITAASRSDGAMWTYSDSNGTFSWSHVPTGAVTFSAEHTRAGDGSVSLSLDGPMHDVRIALSSGCVLTGQLVDRDDMALTDWRVGIASTGHPGLWDVQCTTDEQGNFTLLHCKSGQLLDLMAASPGSNVTIPLNRSVPCGGVPIRVVAPEVHKDMAKVRGTVRHVDHGPVNNTFIWATSGDGQVVPASIQLSTGLFTFDDLSPGHWSICGSSPMCFPLQTGHDLFVGDNDIGEILLQKAAQIAGQVEGPSTSAINYGQLRRADESSDPEPLLVVGSGFESGPVTPADYIVTLGLKNGRTLSRSVHVDSARRLFIQVTPAD